MVFSNFTRSEANNQIFFKNSTPIENVTSIRLYKDNTSGAFKKKDFRWSFNKNYWSSWTSLSQANVSNINTRSNDYLFLEIRYTPIGNSTVTVFSIDYSNKEIGKVCVTPILPSKPTKPTPIPPVYGGSTVDIDSDVLIDADTLNCKDGEYYLWRPNHKGEQPISTITNLQKILNDLNGAVHDTVISGAKNVEGEGIGVYYSTFNKQLYFKTIIEGNKVFVREDAEGHITIDMDDASINDLYSLVGNITGINIGEPSTNLGAYGQIFKQKTESGLEFRSIVGGNANVNVSTVGDQIRISLDASASGAPIWTDGDPVSTDVGGIDNGDTFLDENSIEILEKMLYEYQPPIINLVSPIGGVYEKYVDDFDVSVLGNFNNSNSSKTLIDSASLLINGVESPSWPTIDYSTGTTSGVFSWNVSGPPSYESRIYTVRLENHFEIGPTPMPPADVSVKIAFANPYFFGVVSNDITIDNITSNDITNLNKLIVEKQTNEIDFDVSANYVKLKFVYAFDANYNEISSIIDIKNNFNVTESFDTDIKLVTNGDGNDLPYRVYVKNYWISFTPDVSIFKLKFDI